jgi:uncharacterized protein (DUF2062 family)
MKVPALSRRLGALLQLDDPPWRIALALAVGVFISFTPFYFFQTLLALLVSTIFRLSKVATVAGAWLNLPWFAPLVYAAALRIGTLIVPETEAVTREALTILLRHGGSRSWDSVRELISSVSVALLVGTTILGLVAAALTYVVALRIIRHAGGPRHGPPAPNARKHPRGTRGAPRFPGDLG